MCINIEGKPLPLCCEGSGVIIASASFEGASVIHWNRRQDLLRHWFVER